MAFLICREKRCSLKLPSISPVIVPKMLTLAISESYSTTVLPGFLHSHGTGK